MNYFLHLLLEATVIGFTVVIFGTVISYIIAKLMGKKTNFLKRPSMFIALFLIGFLLHGTYDLLGWNKWYCKNCAGCK
jgi:uncharacterized membrane protein